MCVLQTMLWGVIPGIDACARLLLPMSRVVLCRCCAVAAFDRAISCVPLCAVVPCNTTESSVTSAYIFECDYMRRLYENPFLKLKCFINFIILCYLLLLRNVCNKIRFLIFLTARSFTLISFRCLRWRWFATFKVVWWNSIFTCCFLPSGLKPICGEFYPILQNCNQNLLSSICPCPFYPLFHDLQL